MLKNILIVKSKLRNTRYNFEMSKELSKYFNVTWYIGNLQVDENMIHNERIILANGDENTGNFTIDGFRFAKGAVSHLKKNNYDLVIVHQHRFCFLYPLMAKNNSYLLQMFTSAVCTSKMQRILRDFMDKKFPTYFYQYINVQTKWIVDHFNLRKKKVFITGWGVSRISNISKEFKNLKLLYIGTLNGRNIYKTIYGLKKYITTNINSNHITYDIIGSGSKEENIKILNAINETKLSKIVNVHGYLDDDKIVEYFNKCNVGVGFVPITTYYDNVIATKTYEYLLSGLAVIATRTNENAKIIDINNGILIDDSANGFYKGLQFINKNFQTYNSTAIIKTVEDYSYKSFVQRKLKPMYDEIISNNE